MKQLNHIDLGLAISARHSRFGVPRTAADIAAYCQCSRQRIDQIEKRAIRKLQRNPDLKHWIDHFHKHEQVHY